MVVLSPGFGAFVRAHGNLCSCTIESTHRHVPSAAAAAAAGGYRGFLGAVVEAAAPRLGTFGGMLSRERYEGMKERLECITRLDDMDFLEARLYKTDLAKDLQSSRERGVIL